jgi:hypothetical protein
VPAEAAEADRDERLGGRQSATPKAASDGRHARRDSSLSVTRPQAATASALVTTLPSG